ncbi:MULTISPECIES: SPW repeat protein [unclassified Bradyrhizobium]|uniref:SPW repeat protein n=1 Tax=unclassified Bradyrhizobium TaxID=2631580 RepID=UPI0024784007|nr:MULTISPECIES: SPW repeat protein [unclassified Bradyrhizobium]WGS20576.1 SPW repeat protein [Bradyrhizobium sp. ISRA463]WGS27462.1 SPW repeat protein [Bradyrhizobium sp. ISRA464]
MTSYGTPRGDRQSNAWQDWANLILGLWLFASPWLLHFTGATAAAWNAWIFGAIIAVLAAVALYEVQRWEEWTNVVLGLWVAISPWLLRFSGDQVTMRNALIVGILVLCIAGWELYELPARPSTQQ